MALENSDKYNSEDSQSQIFERIAFC